MQILAASKNCEEIGADTPISAAFRNSVDIWDGLCEQTTLPVWQIDHLLLFPSQLVPYANVTRWEPALDDYRFLFWGSGRSDMMKCDYTSKPLSQLQPTLYADLVRAELSEVLKLQRPMKSSAQVRLSDGSVSQVDKIRLPFRDGDGNVSIVLSIDDVRQFLQRYYLSWAKPETAAQ